MDKLAFAIRIQAIAVTVVISVFAVSSPPVLAQVAAGDTEDEQLVSVDATITGNIEPAVAVTQATTIDNLTIPIDQLELLVKPLTLEELQVEAAAWFLILKEKVHRISEEEIAIKRENQAIQDEQRAIKEVRIAEAKIAKAQTNLAKAQPNTPGYEKAAQNLADAKQTLQQAELDIEDAIRLIKELEQDKKLQKLLAEAQSEDAIATDRQILEKARKQRDKLPIGSAAYQQLTENIDTLAVALVALEAAEEALESSIPGSSEYEEASEKLEQARQRVIEATQVLSSPELGLTSDEPVALGHSEAALAEIDATLKTVENQLNAELQQVPDRDSENSVEQLEATAQKLEQLVDTQSTLKKQLVIDVIALQGEETAIIDRFNVVLDGLERKGGDTMAYRRYVDVVSVLEFDITDTEGLGVRLVSWLQSDEGGRRWGGKIAQFLGILLASVVTSYVLGLVTRILLARFGNTSSLFQEFLTMVVKRGVIVIGFLLALTSLGISLGPILALVGGASFVLAFALQSNLGNFASGLMLLLTKPFDVGDEVKIAGYWAYVDSISLANTTIKDFNANIITLPNNVVWGGDIINYTHSEMRKLSFCIYLKFDQDIEQVKALWFEITAAHPQVLESPSPTIFPWNSHYDYYISVGLKAWCATDIYWSIYVDLLKGLQHRLTELGIELAVPRHDIQLHQEQNGKVSQVQAGWSNGLRKDV